MATQMFDDGSLSVIQNMDMDKARLELIREALKRLTEPNKVMELTEQLKTMKILTDNDIRTLKEKGVINQGPEKIQDLEQQPKEKEEQLDEERE